MQDIYLAMIGDIIGSRKLSDRNEAQLKLQEVLDLVNEKYGEYILSNFTITIGDEMQGLLKPNAPVYDILVNILEENYPVKIRFGLGLGRLTTDNINREMSIGMDGPAFYLAREAIEKAHKQKGYSIVFKSEIHDSTKEEEINVTLGLLSIIRNLWNERFLSIIKLLRVGMKQKDIADELGVSQPYISELVNKSYWKEVLSSERILSTQFKY